MLLLAVSIPGECPARRPRCDSASPHAVTGLYCAFVRKDFISKSSFTVSWNCFFLLSPIYNFCFLPLPFPAQGIGTPRVPLCENPEPGSAHASFAQAQGEPVPLPCRAAPRCGSACVGDNSERLRFSGVKMWWYSPGKSLQPGQEPTAALGNWSRAK